MYIDIIYRLNKLPSTNKNTVSNSNTLLKTIQFISRLFPYNQMFFRILMSLNKSVFRNVLKLKITNIKERELVLL